MSMSEPAAASPKRLGDFEIVREIGRGGMGVVYEAWQSSLKRRVALKVLSGQLGLTSQAVVRFRREAEAAAKLHHTNIVPIYATGEQNGTHYYAMELVEGPSLQVVLRALKQGGVGVSPAGRDDTTTTLPAWVMETIAGPARAHPKSEPEAPAREPAQADSLGHTGGAHFDTIARLVAEIADALDYAHKQGVIHRDIKPSNLLLSPAGRLSINDFGLARVLEQPGMTLTGEFMGTPRYMSPEQIAAGRAPLDHRTDIYSLGATLYELLALQPPFPGERREQVIAQILHKDPAPPRRINKRAPVDLETICLKALEKDPDRRYQTAGQMAEDLRRYVTRFAISARRAGPIARMAKWARRRPAVAALLGVIIILTATAGLLTYGVHRSNARLAAVELQKVIDDAFLAAMSGNVVQAEAAIEQARQRGASAGWVEMLCGQLALDQGQAAEAVKHLEQAVRSMPGSAAPQGLLAVAYFANGDMTRHFEALLALERSPVLTPEDYLFKGYAVGTEDPARALSLLDEAIQRRNSSLARLIHAGARSWTATMSADTADVALAIEDAVAAKLLLPDNPLALGTHLRTELVAAGVFAERGQEPQRAAALAEAERDARALERFVGSYRAHDARCGYFEAIGDAASLLAESRQMAERCGKSEFYADNLWLYGRCQEALDALDRQAEGTRDVIWSITRAYALAGLPGGNTELPVFYAAWIARAPEGVWALHPPTIFLLLGSRSDAIHAARQSRERVARMVPWLFEWYGRILEYQCDLISAEELLRAAGELRTRRCEAHFHIALARLAEGDRAGAADHFRACVETRVFDYVEYVWSRNFLTRLEQDPTWPPWIPVKEGNEATRQQGDETVPGTRPGDPAR